VGRDGEGYSFDLGFGKTEIFLQMGLDRLVTNRPADLPVGQISRCKPVQALQRPADVTASVYRTERNTIANTTSQPTMTNEATAPAVILAFSLVL
jgi:hypothetical protein